MSDDTTGMRKGDRATGSRSRGRIATGNDDDEHRGVAPRQPQEGEMLRTRLGATGDAREAEAAGERPAAKRSKRSRSDREDSDVEGPSLESPPRARYQETDPRPGTAAGDGSSQAQAPSPVAAAAATTTSEPFQGVWDAAGYASRGMYGAARPPDLAALLALAQERELELALARERQLALQASLLRQPPAANLDLQSHLLLLSARLQQHQQQQQRPLPPSPPPPDPYSLIALNQQGLNAQPQLALLQGSAGAALLNSTAQLRSALEQRQREVAIRQLLGSQQVAELHRGALLASSAASAPRSDSAAAPFSGALSVVPPGVRRSSWGSSLSSGEQKEGVGRMWPAAAGSPSLGLEGPSPQPGSIVTTSAAARAPAGSTDASKPAPAMELVKCRFHPRAINVSLPDDAESTSKFQTLLRAQMVYVEAVLLDVQASTQGRNRPIRVGQVGLLCRHCRNIPPKNRPRGAIYFPHKLLSIYQSAQNMANHHYNPESGCPNAPDGVNESLRIARIDKSIVYGGGQQYWARSAVESGLVETDDRGLAFDPNVVPTAAPAGP